MQTIEEAVSRFKTIAHELLQVELEELKQLGVSSKQGGKLGRLKVVNIHLELLKQKLSQSRAQLLIEIKGSFSQRLGEIEKQTNDIFAECIGEYMAEGFNDN